MCLCLFMLVIFILVAYVRSRPTGSYPRWGQTGSVVQSGGEYLDPNYDPYENWGFWNMIDWFRNNWWFK